jgi:cephalosporin hydroxylase
VSNPTAIPLADPAVVTIENSLPPAIGVSPDMTIREYWAARAHQHTKDRYLGIKTSKFPEDLRVYEHLLWVAAPDVVVELGAQSGGSTLWLRDRLRTLETYGALAAPPKVIAVDIDLDAARHNVAARDPRWAETIAFVEGDVCDPAVRAQVGAHVPAGAVCMVIEDSAHTGETTRAALELYSDLVAPGGFFVVEDGCVDVPWMRVKDDWPEGVLPALEAWLATPPGAAFRVRRDLECYGVSCHPSGFLQRVG